MKYLTTNDHALAQFSNGIRNVPSTKSAAKSKELKPDANFATFTRIFANPKSQTTPITVGRLRLPGHVRELPGEVAGGQGERPRRGPP